MANTIWSGTDKTANVTISGVNLIATSSGTSAWVRAVDKQITGKYYWELKPTVWASGTTSVGFCTPTAVPISNVAGVCAVFKSGNIFVSLTNVGALGARVSNDVIGIAVDFGAALAWFRVAPAGTWNGSATANPATATEGADISSIARAFPLYPLAELGAASESVTANFGDTAFSGTVPAGFTSGFTAGATSSTNVVATQLAAEQWGSGTPAVQLTQMALEEWASVATAVVVPGGDTRVMVMA